MTDETHATPVPPPPAPGLEYVIDAHGSMPLSEVRKQVEKQLGFPCHVKAKFGPFEFDGNKLLAPVEAIDDEFLDGSFRFQLIGDKGVKLGYCKYFVVLKEKK